MIIHTQQWPWTRSRAVVWLQSMHMFMLRPLIFFFPLFWPKYILYAPWSERTSAKFHWVLAGARSVQKSFILRCAKAKLPQSCLIILDFLFWRGWLAALWLVLKVALLTDSSLAYDKTRAWLCGTACALRGIGPVADHWVGK